MKTLQEYEFRTLVRQQGKITIPKASGIQPGDFVIVKVFRVPVELETKSS